MPISRRQFLMGCSAAIAAMAGGRVGNLVFAEGMQTAREVLVVVFLRGGCDGLSLVAPFDDPVYIGARAGLAIPGKGPNRALPLATNNASFTSSMGLHPKGGPLKELYEAGHLAIIHACGLDDDTRSHFDAMDYMERGTPGNKATSSGWLTRHLQSVGIAGTLPTLAVGTALPAALLSDKTAVAMSNAQNWKLTTHSRYGNSNLPYNTLSSLKKFYSGTGTPIEQSGRRALEVMDTLKSQNLQYTPAPGVTYPKGSFGDTLELVAQTIKMDVGLQIATADLGGWDTHEHQGNEGGGYFADQVDELALGLHAFYSDLHDHQRNLTVVVMSEFGRRLGANSSNGTDHGHGNVMLLLGGNVNGGNLYGKWPGLLDLDQGQDLRITTDYRTVLSEILIRRLANPNLGTVFPGITDYAPLGVVKGADLAPNLTGQQEHQVFLPLVTR